MGRLLIVCSIVLTLCTSAWADEPFDFKGVPLGASEQSLLEKFPAFKCEDNKNDLSDRVCRLYSFVNEQKPLATYADVQADISMLFNKNRLGLILINFSSDEFKTVRNALKEKYGALFLTNKTQVTNKMGAVFEKESFTWPRDSSYIELEQYTKTLDQSRVTIVLKDMILESGERAKIINKRKSEDL